MLCTLIFIRHSAIDQPKSRKKFVQTLWKRLIVFSKQLIKSFADQKWSLWNIQEIAIVCIIKFLPTLKMFKTLYTLNKGINFSNGIFFLFWIFKTCLDLSLRTAPWKQFEHAINLYYFHYRTKIDFYNIQDSKKFKHFIFF